MSVYSYKGKIPQIPSSVFVGDYSTITGDVMIGEQSSIWFNCTIRGDVAPTIIGKKVNIQDNSVLHQSPGNPLIIEDEVTIGHQVILHSAIIRKKALIGMGSIILDNAEIGEGAFIGAGSLVPQGKIIPPHTVAFGRPAKVIREVNEHDRSEMERISREYAERGRYYQNLQKQNKRLKQ
ncbi:gamma carbonic anhydrase family protein [Siminovitchia sediminis]|uniref:Gamma carbonic anhydrase family protein n=1 Tax=Siminovitchia sediminis TaxID=1274353 RepID=A0ABW4KEU2_9BACI